MQTFKMLVLTDHSNHSSENSLYPLVHAMRKHPSCAYIDVATKGNFANHPFFNELQANGILVNRVDDNFGFSPNGYSFTQNQRKDFLNHYEVIWLRMPPPLSKSFLDFLTTNYPDQLFINDPSGIYKTGSKFFLTNFPDICPPMKVCSSIEDILAFKNQFPIVLKPYREYGGKGIIRIDGDQIWEGKTTTTFDAFMNKIKNDPIEYLGVKFLKNVSQGDKRIIVVNGQIMGASLRLPSKNSWICNVAMGGTSTIATVDQEEIKIVERINPILLKMGIVMYGIDTLVDDDGQRILSEINTTSIGGLPQIAKQNNQPLIQQAVNLIWNYIVTKKKTNVTNHK